MNTILQNWYNDFTALHQKKVTRALQSRLQKQSIELQILISNNSSDSAASFREAIQNKLDDILRTQQYLVSPTKQEKLFSSLFKQTYGTIADVDLTKMEHTRPKKLLALGPKMLNLIQNTRGYI